MGTAPVLIRMGHGQSKEAKETQEAEEATEGESPSISRV
jgi:hypothetical protein